MKCVVAEVKNAIRAYFTWFFILLNATAETETSSPIQCLFCFAFKNPLVSFFFRLVGNLYQTYKAKSNYCLLFPSFTKKAEWIWSSKWMLPRQMIEPPFYLDNPAPDCQKPHCRCRFQAFMPTVQSDAGRCFFPLKDASNRSQPFQLYFPGHLIKPVHYK